MKFSKYATLVAVLGFACAYTVVGCGGGDSGGKGGNAGSKSGGSGGSASGGSASGGSGSGGSSVGGSTTGGTAGTTGGAAPTAGGAGGVPPMTGALIGYWPFDGDAMDKSGMANNGTVVKGGTEAAPATAGTYAAGKKGMALKLVNDTGTLDPTWVKVPRSDSIDSTGTTGAFSITLWANTGAVDPEFNFCLSRHEVGTAFEHFGLGIMSGRPTVAVHFFFAPAAQAVEAGKWTHLAGVYDGITATVYVDGAVGGTLDVGWPIAADTTHLVIGGNQNIDVVKEAWDGSLDEVRLYSTAISAADVMADMAK